jgi:hypothetical protein
MLRKRKRIISKLVEGQRAGIGKRLGDFRGLEVPPLAGLLAILRRISLLSCGGGVLFFSEPIFSRPRCALRKARRERL